MIKNVGEVITAVKNAETAEEKIKLLSEARARVAIAEVLKVASGIEPFLDDLSKNPVEYKPSKDPYPYNEVRLITGYRIFSLFRNESIDIERVRIRLIQTLEALHAEEAEILQAAIAGKLDLGLDMADALKAVGVKAPAAVVTQKVEAEPTKVVEAPVVEAPETEVEQAEPAVETETKPRRGRKAKA